MATATLTLGSWAGDLGSFGVAYDLSTLAVAAVLFENETPKDVAVLVYANGTLVKDAQSPPNATAIIPAGTPPGSVDVSGLKLTLRQVSGSVALPAGVSVGVRMPA